MTAEVNVRLQLKTGLPSQLVDELIDAHSEAKRSFYLGGLRLSAVEGGRFCEAAFRLLEHLTQTVVTPLNATLDAEAAIKRLAGLKRGAFSDSVRLHIPRALRLVYDIRNNRDAAHLADGIDPNLQDAVLVVSTIDWVLAEFLRLVHGAPADVAQGLVEDLVTRRAPIVQDFDGFLKVLRPDLSASEHCLVLLYHRGSTGALFHELEAWVRPPMRSNLRRTLVTLANVKDLVHFDGKVYRITALGQQVVEEQRLLDSTERVMRVS